MHRPTVGQCGAKDVKEEPIIYMQKRKEARLRTFWTKMEQSGAEDGWLDIKRLESMAVRASHR